MRFGLVLLLAAVAAGQTPGKPAAPAMRTFTDSTLGLSFSYPAELTPTDPAAAAELGKSLLYGEDAGDSEKTKSGSGCIRTLVAVGEDQPVMVRLALFEIDLSCLPPKAVKNRKLMDQTLQGLASQGNEELGMTPLDEPAPYLLQGHHAFFASAQGTPVSETALQSSQAEVTATVAAEVEAKGGSAKGGDMKILAWHLETNNAGMFNRLLACPVEIGTGQAQPLFPAQVR